MTETSLSTMEVLEAIKIYSEHVDQKFTEIDRKFSDLDRKFTELLQSFLDFKIQVNDRFDRLEQKVESLEERMSTLVTKQQLNRLLLILETRALLSSHDTEYVRQ